MEDAVDYPLSLNLLPLERQKRLLMNKELTLYASSLTIILATFIVLAGIFWLNNRLMQGRINTLNKQLEEITPSLDKLIREYSKNVDLDQRISEGSQIITEANSKSIFSSGFLAEVMVLVPEGMWLTDISGQLKEHSLIFVGNALEEKTIFEYVDNLTKTGYFSKVEPIFSEIQEKTLQFLIKCQLKI